MYFRHHVFWGEVGKMYAYLKYLHKVGSLGTLYREYAQELSEAEADGLWSD